MIRPYSWARAKPVCVVFSGLPIFALTLGNWQVAELVVTVSLKQEVAVFLTRRQCFTNSSLNCVPAGPGEHQHLSQMLICLGGDVYEFVFVGQLDGPLQSLSRLIIFRLPKEEASYYLLCSCFLRLYDYASGLK